MSVSTLTTKWEYTAGAAQTTFPYTNVIFKNTEIKVFVDGVLRSLGAGAGQYSVTGVTNPTGGNVVFVTPLVGGELVQLETNVELTQLTDFPYAGPFAESQVEGALDKLTRITQDLGRRFQESGLPPQMVRVKRTAVQSIPDSTDTAIQFDNEEFDTDNMHDNAVNNTRLVAPIAGKYLVGGNVRWAVANNGTRALHIRQGGTTKVAHNHIPTHTSDEIANAVSTLVSLTAGQFVELVVWQDSGGPLDVDGGAGECVFWMKFERA